MNGLDLCERREGKERRTRRDEESHNVHPSVGGERKERWGNRIGVKLGFDRIGSDRCVGE